MKLSLVSILAAALLAFASQADAADKPTIAIIGTGDLGDSLGSRLAELGYPVVCGCKRGMVLRPPRRQRPQRGAIS